MLDQLIALTSKLRLWQIAIIISIVLLALGFTGGIPYTEIDLISGESEIAIRGGIFFFLIGIALKLLMTFTGHDD